MNDVQRLAHLNNAQIRVAQELAGEYWDGANKATREYYIRQAKERRSKRILEIFHASLKEAGLEP